ncbi:MAG: hypothetical protein ACK5WZ_00930, partial [Pseudobdellovibrionaceae bacterium]
MLTKFFTIAFFLICSVQGFYATANTTPPPTPTPDVTALLLRGAERQECNSLSREYRDQLEKYNGYCGQAGGGGSSSGGSEDCSAIIERCQTEVSALADGVRDARSTTESMQTMQTASQSAMQSGGFASLLGAAGSAYANPERILSSIQGTCPGMSSKDYNTSYREIKNDIKDVKKRIAEERKEILKKQTELEKDQQDITKDSTKAKEKYEKAKLDMERKRQDQSEEHFKNTQKAQKTLGEIETRAMRLNLEYSRILTDESATTQQYMAYAERNITAGCRAQVQKQRTELLGNTNQKRGSSMNLIRQGTDNNKTLQNL